MLTVTRFSPAQSSSTVVNLNYQSGIVEVINDTNYLLILTFHNGTIQQPAGTVYIYPIQDGGGPLTIQTINTAVYMNFDQGPVNLVTINVYYPEELLGRNYPYALPAREVMLGTQLLQNFQPGNVAAISSGLSLTCSPLTGATGDPYVPTANTAVYCWGWDLSIDKESTAHHVPVTLTTSAFGAFNTYHFYTQTAAALVVQWRYTEAIGVPPGTTITLSFPAIVGGTAQASMALFCYQM
jgi:hypothetical protein